MDNMDTKRRCGSQSRNGFVDWATMGMAGSLAVSVREALHAIASTGECKAADATWTLFGEVTEVLNQDPLQVHVRRASMLMNEEDVGDVWPSFDLICPVKHERVDLSVGMKIGVQVQPCHRQHDGKIIADASVPLWNVSSFDKHLAWNVSHLFAGAYEGWLRAMWWLQQANQGFSVSTHTCVDWCPEVMKTWSFNHGQEVHKAPIEVGFNPHEAFNGICSDVSELTLPRATFNKSNLVMTLSPPCPSWSRGGRNSGLATDEGFCFLDAIHHVAKVRPVLALFECSDGIEAHQHWRALSAAMQLSGYKKLWSQDVAIHQLTGNHRNRWLAVWARQDLECHKLTERIVCSAVKRVPWDDPKHTFHLPQSMIDDLCLQPEQLEIYGDRQLLPPGKRARMSEDALTQQVLEQRLLQQGDYLPTLCASYTGQHLLQRDHLDLKGIFATLVRHGDSFRFIDPFTFVALFGTSDSIGLPTDLRKAFHQLGNAISQLHALVAILFAIEGVSGDTHPKLALVQQCWEDRLTVDKAFVRQWGDMFVLQPFADFVSKALPSIVTWQPWLSSRTLIRFGDDLSLVPMNVSASRQAISLLLDRLDLEVHHSPLLRLFYDGCCIPADSKWDDLPCGAVDLKLGTHTMCSLQIVRTGTDHIDVDPILSPTQPWEDDEVDPGLDHLVDAQQCGFLHVLEHVCQDEEPQHKGRVLFLQQDGSFEWIKDANLERLGSIPTFRYRDRVIHFFKANKEACQQLLGIHVVMAIQGTYDPVGPSKWVLLAGGQDLRWCKICQAQRTVTPQQCNEMLGQTCDVTLRNLVKCPVDQPMMLINGDVLWSGPCPRPGVPLAFGGMDRLTDNPSCNIRNDIMEARLLQFNFEPGALALDEMVFHCDFLQMLMPSICWCPPAIWINNESQFRFPVQPSDLQRCYQHFVVPILVVFDWIFVEVRLFDGQWRVLYHSPEQLTVRQTTAVLELINVMGIQVAPNAYRWVRTPEDSELATWHTLRTFYARAGAPLLQTSHRSTQRLQRDQCSAHVMQIIDQSDFVWRETRADDRMIHFAQAARTAFLIAITESPSRAADLILRATGREVHAYDVREIFFVSEEWLDMRLNIYRTHPGWATSDEIEFAMSFFMPDTFCPPVLHHDLSLIAPSVKPTSFDVQRL